MNKTFILDLGTCSRALGSATVCQGSINVIKHMHLYMWCPMFDVSVLKISVKYPAAAAASEHLTSLIQSPG